jgi:hypothetical protein
MGRLPFPGGVMVSCLKLRRSRVNQLISVYYSAPGYSRARVINTLVSMPRRWLSGNF